MDKQLYSSDIVWYDPVVYKAIMSLDDKHPNAIPVFGGALSASKHIESAHYDKFIKCLSDVIHNAQFYGWHEDIPATLRRFCHLCLIDPKLIELYLGCTFEEVARHYHQ